MSDSEVLSSDQSFQLDKEEELCTSDEEEEIERQALSPRTRMSITGIRPSDLSDSSEIEYSEEQSMVESSNIYTSDEEEMEMQSLSHRTHMNSTGIRATDFSDLSEVECSEKSYSKKSYDDMQNQEITKKAEPHCRKSNNRSSLLEQPVAESDKTDSSAFLRKDLCFRTDITPPVNSTCRSTLFETDVKEKLLSIIQQASPKEHHRCEITESDDSDVLVVSMRDKTIEISSSSGDASIEEVIKGDVIRSNSSMAQPKITTKLLVHTKDMLSAQTKSLLKKEQLVSQEFFNKEMKKLQDLKSELKRSQKLLERTYNSLPDNGKQLSIRIDVLRNDIFIKENYIETLKVEDNNKMLPLKQEEFKGPDVISWDAISAGVNQMQPIHTGRQGLATFNNQRELTMERLKDIHSSLKSCPSEDILADDPVGLRVPLMEHQQHALAWMRWREKQKPRGGILADDMGLGKTLTMIALVLADKNILEEDPGDDNSKESASDDEGEENVGWTSRGRRTYYQGGTLVICPASLVKQWESEVESKVKSQKLSVCIHHGSNRNSNSKYLRKYDIVITTYNIVSRELKSEGALFGIKWQRIILDEAHIVRNHKAQMSVGVCGLRGKYRWAVTGTPIQNKEMDIYALLKFLRCSPFNELAHWKKWIDQQRLNALMKSLMLRRTKVLLQERGTLQCLPQKRIDLIEVYLDKDEMNVYQKIMIYSRTLFTQFLHQRSERNADLVSEHVSNHSNFMPKEGPTGAYYRMHQKFTKIHKGKEDVKSHEILLLLLRLRQICCHPGLIDSMLDDGDVENIESDGEDEKIKIDLLEQLNKLTISEKEQDNSNNNDENLNPDEEFLAKASAKVLLRSNPVFDLKRPSSKILKVLEILKKNVLKGCDKAIVVSQWTSVLNILKIHLEEQGIGTLSLNGKTAVKNRQEIVTTFNNAHNKERVLLLSLTAGGVGLNLVGANHLLLIDLHWNPQLEAQAQDRIYRVGQKKDVIIYKFMCKDTVEERIKALQDHKMSLANGVLTGVRATQGSTLSMDDLKRIFGM